MKEIVRSEYSELYAEVEGEFRRGIPSIFGEELIMAQIFGGFGKGYAGPEHDIDMIVLLDRVTVSKRSQFEDWYIRLHALLELPPDLEYPGELVVVEDLLDRLAYLETVPIRPIIETQYEYEAILWTDAISEPCIGQILAHQARASEIINRCARLNRRWRRQFMRYRPDLEDDVKDLDLRRLFKGYIEYQKRPGRPTSS